MNTKTKYWKDKYCLHEETRNIILLYIFVLSAYRTNLLQFECDKETNSIVNFELKKVIYHH